MMLNGLEKCSPVMSRNSKRELTSRNVETTVSENENLEGKTFLYLKFVVECGKERNRI